MICCAVYAKSVGARILPECLKRSESGEASCVARWREITKSRDHELDPSTLPTPECEQTLCILSVRRGINICLGARREPHLPHSLYPHINHLSKTSTFHLFDDDVMFDTDTLTMVKKKYRYANQNSSALQFPHCRDYSNRRGYCLPHGTVSCLLGNICDVFILLPMQCSETMKIDRSTVDGAKLRAENLQAAL